MSANSKLLAVASSTYMNEIGDTFPASNVLNGIHGNDCNKSNAQRRKSMVGNEMVRDSNNLENNSLQSCILLW